MKISEQRKVLIVEDDPDMRAGIVAMIRAQGFTPIAVGEGEKALPSLEAHQVVLLLLDVKLPGMSGLDVLKIVRQHPRYQQIPVIMLTAESADHQMLEGYEFGADYYIPKPFNIKQLRYGIKLCLSGDA